jgi:hypothetical protein
MITKGNQFVGLSYDEMNLIIDLCHAVRTLDECPFGHLTTGIINDMIGLADKVTKIRPAKLQITEVE